MIFTRMSRHHVPSQSCVLSLFSLLLLTIGSICMMTDALGKPVSYITAVILEMITNTNTNNVAANEHFLDHMYRIVRGWCNIASFVSHSPLFGRWVVAEHTARVTTETTT